MTLLPKAITWDGITIGSDPAAALYLAEGIDGWGQPSFNMPSTPRSMGGEFGGMWTAQGMTYTVNAWLDLDKAGERDRSKFLDVRDSMSLRPHPDDEIPLAWSELLWPGEVCAFARPTRCVPAVDEDAVEGGTVGWDLQWLATDPVVYSYDQEIHTVPTEDPGVALNFEVANSGALIPWARRSWEFRMTAHGTVTNPRIRVDHADGTFEQITLSGLTMTGGQVLTFGADQTFRVQSRIVSGHVRSLTHLGVTSRAPRHWLLHPSDGEDGANSVTMSVATGAFSGFCKTRSTR